MLHSDDVSDALTAWVIGQCYLHNDSMGIFPYFMTPLSVRPLGDVPGERSPYLSPCSEWVSRCITKAHSAVFRGFRPGGSESDFECELMLKARRVFGVHLEKREGA